MMDTKFIYPIYSKFQYYISFNSIYITSSFEYYMGIALKINISKLFRKPCVNKLFLMNLITQAHIFNGYEINLEKYIYNFTNSIYTLSDKTKIDAWIKGV